MKKTKFDAIIIGAGISGLLTALALSKEKKSVLIIEKQDYIGGNCRSYEINEYYVDTGPHIITELINGPLKILMDKYFSIIPKFTPIGSYYARWQNKLQEIPTTITQLPYFDILSRKDRILLIGIMIDAVANSSINKNAVEKSVYDYIKNYHFSTKSIKFIDTMCYFLSGKSMKETPVSRMLEGSGYIDENHKNAKSCAKQHIKKIIKFVKYNYNSHGYPVGGIQGITSSILNSIPKNKVCFKTNEKAIKFIVEKNRIKGVQTDKDIYYGNAVVYSGFVKNLPYFTDKFDSKYKTELKKIKQTKSVTLWLGLKNKIPEMSYIGSEVYFDTNTPYWAIPISNFDSNLAPKNKQLIGFTTIIKENDAQKQIKKLKHSIFTALPNIKKNIEFEHIQTTIPEKAAVTVGVKFPSPKSPINKLYLVGTDTDKRSMGITKASYSVIEALKFMKADKII
ncbi:MAG: NAD(P)/FAD-dependent oxidoreductase [Patescibacteria group bacterium]|nr:NAD(P)/FAD-dependent oxidoreductase [Patescibacteria group bacterium]